MLSYLLCSLLGYKCRHKSHCRQWRRVNQQIHGSLWKLHLCGRKLGNHYARTRTIQPVISVIYTRGNLVCWCTWNTFVNDELRAKAVLDVAVLLCIISGTEQQLRSELLVYWAWTC